MGAKAPGSSVDGQYRQVPRKTDWGFTWDRLRDQARPGPIPFPGWLNETSLKGNLLGGLLVVQSTRPGHATPIRWFEPPLGNPVLCPGQDICGLPFYRLSAERGLEAPFWRKGRRTPSPLQGDCDVPSCQPNGLAHIPWACFFEFGVACRFRGAGD